MATWKKERWSYILVFSSDSQCSHCAPCFLNFLKLSELLTYLAGCSQVTTSVTDSTLAIWNIWKWKYPDRKSAASVTKYRPSFWLKYMCNFPSTCLHEKLLSRYAVQESIMLPIHWPTSNHSPRPLSCRTRLINGTCRLRNTSLHMHPFMLSRGLSMLVLFSRRTCLSRIVIKWAQFCVWKFVTNLTAAFKALRDGA